MQARLWVGGGNGAKFSVFTCVRVYDFALLQVFTQGNDCKLWNYVQVEAGQIIWYPPLFIRIIIKIHMVLFPALKTHQSRRS